MALIKLTQKEYKELLFWHEKFMQFDRMKKTANILYLYKSIPQEQLDKRMNFAAKVLKKVEPVSTFENGCLTDKARHLLNICKLYKAGIKSVINFID